MCIRDRSHPQTTISQADGEKWEVPGSSGATSSNLWLSETKKTVIGLILEEDEDDDDDDDDKNR